MCYFHIGLGMGTQVTGMANSGAFVLKGDILEDPANEPKKDMYMMTADPEDAPNTPEYVFCP